MFHLIKIAVVGNNLDTSRSFCEKYLGALTGPSKINTIGADFYVKSLNWESKVIKLQSWLLPTQERFNSIRSTYLSASHAGIIIIDLSKTESFENVQKNVRDIWENNVQIGRAHV